MGYCRESGTECNYKKLIIRYFYIFLYKVFLERGGVIVTDRFTGCFFYEIQKRLST